MTSPSDNGRRRHEDVQSFGRRKGRKLRAAAQRLADELLPKLRIDIAGQQQGGRDGSPDIAELTRLFGSAASPADAPPQIWLEIGFGGGEHLVWQAAHNRQVNFIGCEPFLDGVVKVLRAVEDQNLSNIRLYDDDARHLLRWLPAASIDRTFLLFPDPWPKKRQQKRRLLSLATLDLLARVMKPGAELRIGTDIADYAQAILLAVKQHPQFDWRPASPDDWRVRPPDWPETRYEQKAGQEGRSCSYFSFVRT